MDNKARVLNALGAEPVTCQAIADRKHLGKSTETGIPVFFADPQSPWQRGTNENTNGLLRQYFPKGTDISRWSAEEIEAVAHALNTRPRKTLGWRTPADIQRATTVTAKSQCCNDRLNPANSPHGWSGRRSAPPAYCQASAPSATAWTTP